MPGRPPGRSSPTTSPRTRSSASLPARRSRKDEVESGTIEQTLPGLDGSQVPPQPAAGASVARSGSRRRSASRRRAGSLASRSSRSGSPSTSASSSASVELKTFANGETYCRYDDSIRGADMFIVQTGRPPVDQHLVELLIMVNAAKLASAKRITAVIPWYFYARQDKKSRPREPITAPLVADLLADRGRRPRADDGSPCRPGAGLLHDPGRPHDRRADVRAVRPRPPRPDVERVAVAPGHRARQARRQVRRDDRWRPRHPQQGAARPQPGAGHRRDRRRRGQDRRDDRRHHRHRGNARRRRRGAEGGRGDEGLRVRDPRPLQRARRSSGSRRARFDAIVVTDTVPVDPRRRSPTTSRCSRSRRILAETIHNVFADDSVSAIFAGENQLF